MYIDEIRVLPAGFNVVNVEKSLQRIGYELNHITLYILRVLHYIYSKFHSQFAELQNQCHVN